MKHYFANLDSSYWKEWWNSFKKLSLLVSILAIIASFVFWRWNANDKIDMIYFLASLIVACVLLATFFDLSLRSHSASRKKLPKVLRGMAPKKPYQGFLAQLVLEPSELFSTDSLV